MKYNQAQQDLIAIAKRLEMTRIAGITDWPEDIPYPQMWKRMRGDLLDELYDLNSLDDTMIKSRKFFMSQGWGFEPGDVAEIIINWTLMHEDCRIFKFSEKLIEALLQTNFKSVPSELIQLPYERVYLDFSQHQLVLEIEEHRSLLRGSIMSIDRGRDGARALRMHNIRYAPGGKDFIKRDYPFGFNSLNFPLKAEEDFELPDTDEFENVTKETTEFLNEGFEKGVYTSKEGDYGREWARTGSLFVRLTINALLYINSINAEWKEEWVNQKLYKKWKASKGNKRARFRRDLYEQGRLYHCGTKLQIPTVPTDINSSRSDRKIGVRFQCRGHWRHYWVGPLKSPKRKRILRWIEPHWKGPDMAEVVKDKVYDVKTKEESTIR